MTHLPFVAASYALGVLLPAGYAIAAWHRMRLASRRLANIPRPRRSGTGRARAPQRALQ
jgi:hypothetical protein